MPSNQLAVALWLESDRMGFLLDRLDPSVLDTEREVVRNEHRSTTVDAPYQLVHRFIRNLIFSPGRPYRWEIDTEMTDLASISLDDLRAFYRRYHVPNNASLVIAGDIDLASARRLVNTYFASLPRGASPRTDHTIAAPSVPKPVRIEVEVGATMPRIMIG